MNSSANIGAKSPFAYRPDLLRRRWVANGPRVTPEIPTKTGTHHGKPERVASHERKPRRMPSALARPRAIQGVLGRCRRGGFSGDIRASRTIESRDDVGGLVLSAVSNVLSRKPHADIIPIIVSSKELLTSEVRSGPRCGLSTISSGLHQAVARALSRQGSKY